jgi:hypothetical protein
MAHVAGSTLAGARAEASVRSLRRIVADSPEGTQLLGDRGAARWAAEAFELCCDWNVDLGRELAGASQSDFRAFLAWRRRYLAALAENGWIDRAQIAGLLADDDRLPAQRLILADLDEPTPRQRELFARLERAGYLVGRWSAPACSAARQRVQLADARDELRTAVAWARARLRAQPSERIALVVPALDERRAELERALEEPLAGGAATEGAAVPSGMAAAPWPSRRASERRSMRCPLGTEAAAFETLSRWLRSPFFGDGGELSALSALERELRLDVRAQLRFAVAYRETDLAALLRRTAPRAAVSLAEALRETHPIERATPSAWALAWQRALAKLEWTGASDPEDSQRWQAGLDDFSRLTPILGEIDQGAALTELRRALEAPAPVRCRCAAFTCSSASRTSARATTRPGSRALRIRRGLRPRAPIRSCRWLCSASTRCHGARRRTGARAPRGRSIG